MNKIMLTFSKIIMVFFVGQALSLNPVEARNCISTKRGDCILLIPTSTVKPTIIPTRIPTIKPTSIPTSKPTSIPTIAPTRIPTVLPSPTSIVLSSSGFVSRSGQNLMLDQKQYKFIGVNNYNLAYDRVKFSCGYLPIDPEVYLSQMFANLKAMSPVSAVRFWAFQGYAQYNPTTKTLDYTQIDRIIRLAKANGVKIIPVLENEWGDCTTGVMKTSDWYSTCYKDKNYVNSATNINCPNYYNTSGNNNGLNYNLTYKDYVGQLVAHYKNEPSILMWQLMNEAESKTKANVSDPAPLYNFASDMGTYIKSIDSNHLLSLGTIGSDVGGLFGGNYKWIHSIPQIDVVESHDYGEESVALPSMIAEDMADATALNKPFFIGEAGMETPNISVTQRANYFKAKIDSVFTKQADGYLVWYFQNDNSGSYFDSMGFDPVDPLYQVLKGYPAYSCFELGTCLTESFAKTTKFDWESSTEGWVANGSTNTTMIDISNVQAKSGNKSLKANINIAKSSWGETSISNPLSTVQNWSALGTDLVTYIYVPVGTGDLTATIYIKDANYAWFDSSFVNLIPGMWNEVVWKNAPLSSIRTIGIKFGASNYAYNNLVYIDAFQIWKKL